MCRNTHVDTVINRHNGAYDCFISEIPSGTEKGCINIVHKFKVQTPVFLSYFNKFLMDLKICIGHTSIFIFMGVLNAGLGH